MANQHIFDFKIPALPNLHCWVSKWRCSNYGLSSDYSIDIDLMIPIDYDINVEINSALVGNVNQPMYRLMGQLIIWDETESKSSNPRNLNGWIQAFSVGERIGLDKQHLEIKLVSPIHTLKQATTSRVFRNQTVKDMVERILAENQWPPGSFSFKGGNNLFDNLPKEPWIIQDKESDYNFIMRYLAKYGLMFTFEHSTEGVEWIIFKGDYLPNLSAPPNLSKSSIHYLECIEPKGMGYNKPSVLKIYQKSCLLDEALTFQGGSQTITETEESSYSTSSRSLVAPSSRGLSAGSRIDTSRIDPVDKPRDDGPRLLPITHITTTAKNLIPGQALELVDPSNSALSGHYRVISLELKGDQRVGFPEWKPQPNSPPIDFIAYATLMPIDAPIVPVFTPKRNCLSLLSANIVGDNNITDITNITTTKSLYPTLDKHGNYFVRFPCEAIESSNISQINLSCQRTLASSSSPTFLQSSIPLLQPFAGNNFGCHFPIKSPTEVIVSWVEGSGEIPTLLGVLPNQETSTSVKNNEPFVHRLRTLGDNGIEFCDLKAAETIQLYTAFKHNLLLLDATHHKQQVVLSSNQGTIHLRAKLKVQFKTAEHHTVKIKGNITMDIKNDCSVTIQDQNFSIRSSDNFYFETANDLQWKIKRDVNFQANQQINISAKQHLGIRVAENATMVTPEKVSISAGKNLTLRGRAGGSLRLKQGNNTIQAANGNLILKSERIILKAGAIYMPASGEFTL